MGYSTDFSGELEFTTEPTVRQVVEIKKFMGEDCREHPEWDSHGMTWINLELTANWDGIQWNGDEKSYDMVEKINMIVEHMRKNFDPEFGFKGEMTAQGEEHSDTWRIVCMNGKASTVDITVIEVDEEITCPHCKKKFNLEA